MRRTNLALAALAVTVAGSCSSSSDEPTQQANETLAPVMKRIDAVGIELVLLPTWKPGGPTPPGPNEAAFFRGTSSAEPDATFLVTNQDMDLSDADDDRLLFIAKQVGGQIVRAGGTCEVVKLGERSVGRCQLVQAPLDKLTYTAPDGGTTYTFLFMSRNGGRPMSDEAASIVSSLRRAER